MSGCVVMVCGGELNGCVILFVVLASVYSPVGAASVYSPVVLASVYSPVTVVLMVFSASGYSPGGGG